MAAGAAALGAMQTWTWTQTGASTPVLLALPLGWFLPLPVTLVAALVVLLEVVVVLV